MAITQEGRPMGTYSLGVFHTLLSSTLCTKLEVKSDLSVESVPSLVWLICKSLLFSNCEKKQLLFFYQFFNLFKKWSTWIENRSKHKYLFIRKQIISESYQWTNTFQLYSKFVFFCDQEERNFHFQSIRHFKFFRRIK